MADDFKVKNGVIIKDSAGVIGTIDNSGNTTVNAWKRTGVTFSVAGNETSPTGIFFKPDGTKMFIVGTAGDNIVEYTLSTAWNISTAGSPVESASIGDSSPADLYISPDGTRLYVIGQTADTVRQFTINTAWSMASITFVQAFSVSAQDTTPQALFFRDDGTRMYTMGSGNDTIYQFNLGTAWDISTAGTPVGSYAFTQDGNPSSFTFNDDGTKLWLLGGYQRDIFEYSLGTAWTVSTLSFTKWRFLHDTYNAAGGIFVKENQNKAFLIVNDATAGDIVVEFDTTPDELNVTSSRGIMLTGDAEVTGDLQVSGTLAASRLYSRGTAEIRGSLTTASSATFGTVSGGVTSNGTLTAAAAVTFSAQTSTIAIGTSQTTGVTTIGATGQTGTITIGQSTAAQTLTIAGGVTAAATTKVVDIAAVASNATSTTNISIGTLSTGTVNTTIGSTVAAGGSITLNQAVSAGSNITATGFVKSAGLKDSSDRTLLVKDETGTVVWGN